MRVGPGGLPDPVDGRQAGLALAPDQLLGVEEALVVRAVGNRRKVGVHRIL